MKTTAGKITKNENIDILKISVEKLHVYLSFNQGSVR